MSAITSFNPIFPSAHIVIPETTTANVTSLHGRPFPGIRQESYKVVVGSVSMGGNTIDVVVVETGLLVEEVLVDVLELVRAVVVDVLPGHAGQERRHCITESRTHEPADQPILSPPPRRGKAQVRHIHEKSSGKPTGHSPGIKCRQPPRQVHDNLNRYIPHYYSWKKWFSGWRFRPV
jgi:hypothetical protein